MNQIDSTYIDPAVLLESTLPPIPDAVVASAENARIKTKAAADSVHRLRLFTAKDTLPSNIPGPREMSKHFDIFKAGAIELTPVEEVAEPEPAIVVEPPAWQTGLEGEPRSLSVGDDSGVLAIIASIFIMIMLSYKHIRRIFNNLGQDLWGMRRRANAFNEHTTNEARTIALMALQWCIYAGLLLYSGLGAWHGINPAQAFPDAAKLIALAGGYYLCELCIYNLLGYTFTDNTGRKLLIKGYNASQSISGFLIIIPTLVALFYPKAVIDCITVSAVLYIMARISFIIKGFRIFYTNFGSLLYFILYLCALEIVPILIVYKIALLLVS